VILPVIFAVTVWFLVGRYRRRWPSVVVLVLALAFLAALGLWADGREVVHTPVIAGAVAGAPRVVRTGSIPTVLVLLWPYTALVGVIGAFIAVMPRPRGKADCCPACDYDLSGLPALGLKCPECGAAWTGAGSGLESPREALIPSANVATRQIRNGGGVSE
jgi:hypothetical protein